MAYAIWSGLGILIITIAAYFIHGQTIDAMGMLGLALIVAGVGVLNLLSKSAGLCGRKVFICVVSRPQQQQQ